MMPAVHPGKEVQEEDDEEKEYDRMKYDNVFPWSRRWKDVPETDCRGGHEAEIDEVKPGMSLSLQQVESPVNDSKIEGNLDVVEEQEQYRPLGGSGFVENLGSKEQSCNIKNCFRQQVAGYSLDEDIRIPSQKQGQEGKDEFQQHIKFNSQLFIGRTMPSKAISDVDSWIKELLHDQKKPEDLLQPYVIVCLIVPDLVQVQPLAPDDRICGTDIVFGATEEKFA